MPELELGERRLYYEVHGAGEPLLCIMGLGADRLAWSLQVPFWSRHLRTIVFDNRDVGLSTYAAEPYEVADLAADALALADTLELDRFHVVGVSMGGMVAQELALAAPTRIASLTLAVTYGGAGRYGREAARVLAREFAGATREEQLDRLLLLCLSEELFEDERGVAFLRSMMLANPHPQRPEGFLRQLEASSRHEVRDRLRALTMPVHVIGAERDILIPVWKSVELAELIPGARLTVLERAPHALQLEQAERFNQVVLDFVLEHAA